MNPMQKAVQVSQTKTSCHLIKKWNLYAPLTWQLVKDIIFNKEWQVSRNWLSSLSLFALMRLLEQTTSFKYPSLWIDSDLSFKQHIEYNQQINLKSRSTVSFSFTFQTWNILLHSCYCLDYADIVYQNTKHTFNPSMSFITASVDLA